MFKTGGTLQPPRKFFWPHGDRLGLGVLSPIMDSSLCQDVFVLASQPWHLSESSDLPLKDQSIFMLINQPQMLGFAWILLI